MNIFKFSVCFFLLFLAFGPVGNVALAAEENPVLFVTWISQNPQKVNMDL